MDGEDATGVAECLRVCPLDDVVCAQVCARAAAVGARRRGTPLYVPFRQDPTQDWAGLLPYWQRPEASLAEPLRRAEDEASARCHRACEAKRPARPAQWGHGPLACTGAAGSSDALVAAEADDIFSVIRRYLEDAAEPGATDSKNADGFRAAHIPINGQPVAFRQAPPVPYAPDLAEVV